MYTNVPQYLQCTPLLCMLADLLLLAGLRHCYKGTITVTNSRMRKRLTLVLIPCEPWKSLAHLGLVSWFLDGIPRISSSSSKGHLCWPSYPESCGWISRSLCWRRRAPVFETPSSPGRTTNCEIFSKNLSSFSRRSCSRSPLPFLWPSF